MDARDKHHSDKARSVAADFGLETVDVDAMKAITPAEWRAWGAMPQTRRIVGFLCEGLVACQEGAEVADTKRRHMRGMTPAVKNRLAGEVVIGRQQAEIYRKLLQGIGYLANKAD